MSRCTEDRNRGSGRQKMSSRCILGARSRETGQWAAQGRNQPRGFRVRRHLFKGNYARLFSFIMFSVFMLLQNPLQK